MHSTRSRFALIAVPLAALAMAACGSDSNKSTATTPTTVAAPATVAAVDTTVAPDTVPASGAAADIQLADSSLGKILVDGAGNTLYLFTKDTASTSACSGDCSTNWPALVVEGTPTLGEGLAAEDFGTITGADGATQVTFYGHPLYHYAGDTSPGDTNGQGIGGFWFVVDTEGNAIK